MTRQWDVLERPYQRQDCELVRNRRDGTYWQAADGLVVRVAAAEPVQEAEGRQRALLALAVSDAEEQ